MKTKFLILLLIASISDGFAQSILRTPATTNSDPAVVAAWLGITGGGLGTNGNSWNIGGNRIDTNDSDYSSDIGTKAGTNWPTLQHYTQIISEGGPAAYWPNSNGWAFVGQPSAAYDTSGNWIENPQTAIGPVWIWSGRNNKIHDNDVGTTPTFLSTTRFPYNGEFIVGGYSNVIQIAAGSPKTTNWFIGIINGIMNKLDASVRPETNSVIITGRTNEIRGASDSLIGSGVNVLVTNSGVVVFADGRPAQKRSTVPNQMILDFENGVIINGVLWTNGSGGVIAGSFILTKDGLSTNLTTRGYFKQNAPRIMGNATIVTTTPYLTTTNDSVVWVYPTPASSFVNLTNAVPTGYEITVINGACEPGLACFDSSSINVTVQSINGDQIMPGEAGFTTSMTLSNGCSATFQHYGNTWYVTASSQTGLGSGSTNSGASTIKETIAYSGVSNAYVNFSYAGGVITLTNDAYLIPTNLPGTDGVTANYSLEIRQGTGGYHVNCDTNLFRFQGDSFPLFPNTTNIGYGDLWELRSWNAGTNVAVLQAFKFRL